LFYFYYYVIDLFGEAADNSSDNHPIIFSIYKYVSYKTGKKFE